MFVFFRAVAVRAGVAVGGAAGLGLGAFARHVAAADMNRGSRAPTSGNCSIPSVYSQTIESGSNIYRKMLWDVG